MCWKFLGIGISFLVHFLKLGLLKMSVSASSESSDGQR